MRSLQKALGSPSIGREKQGAWARTRRRGLLATITAVVLVAALVAAPEAGAIGFQNTGSFSDPAMTGPRAIAVDPESGNVYVAQQFGSDGESPGSLLRFDGAGTPLSLANMGSAYYNRVAVERGGDHTIYGFASFTETPHVDAFTVAGSAVGSPFPFEPGTNSFGQMASDAAGNIYLPVANGVRKYTSTAIAGTPAEFTCTGGDCDSIPLENPRSVAVDPGGNIYVADNENGRVVEFKPDGSYDSVFYEGASWEVAIDETSGVVLVAGDDEGLGYHVTALDTSGDVIGEIPTSEFEGDFSIRLAINPTTQTVYAAELAENSKVSIYKILGPPTATTEPASAVSATAATLNGTVNPEGVLNEDCHFEYTDDADFQANEWANAESAPCEPEPFDEETDVATSADVTGLSPSTTYDYRVVEGTAGGTAEGDPEQFTTLTSPTATTGAASGISQHAATLAGTVNPNGEATTNCHIEWGPAAGNYSGGQAACSPNPGSASSNTPVSVTAGGLAAGTTYHYRVVETTVAGTANGADMSFATPADTCATNAALCPPSGGSSGSSGSTPPPPPPAGKEDSPRNQAAYKVCVKKAGKAYKKAKGKSKTAAARKAAKAKKAKAIKKCKARYL